MSKEKVIEYVMNSPYNTNRAVLEGLLDDIGGEEWNTLFEEEVTTIKTENSFSVGSLTYDEFVNVDTLKVIYDGVEYECDMYTEHGQYYYGAAFEDTGEETNMDFSKYPFVLSFTLNHGNMIATSVPGVHTIKIEAPKESEDSSSDWSVAEVTFYNDALSKIYTVECAQVKNDMVVIDRIAVPDARQGEVAGSIISGTAVAHIPIYGTGYVLDSKNVYNADYTSVGHSGNIELSGNDFLIKGNGTITLTGTQSESN